VRKAIGAALGVVVLLAAGTYLAGEQTEVVVLRTFDAGGTVHETKLWAVDHEGAVWVRVANPERGWYRRLRAHPRVELVRGGRARAMDAAPDASPEARRAVDAAFAARYGWVDAWYGLLLRRAPVPVRLTPADA
jgi:hypothetical protein